MSGMFDHIKDPRVGQQERMADTSYQGSDAALFVKSAISSVPELFGADPFSGVEKFRTENPIAGFTSEMIGIPLPYVGWATGLKKVSTLNKFNKAVNRLGNISETPFKTRMLQETVRFAPLEGARILSASMVADGDNFMDTVYSAGFNLGSIGAIGGVAGKLGSIGKTRRAENMLAGTNLDQPFPMSVREAREKLTLAGESGTVELSNALKRQINDLDKNVRLEEVTGKYFTPELSGGKDSKQLERLFNVKNNQDRIGIKSRLLARVPSRGFSGAKELEDVMKSLELPEDFTSFTFFPRHIEANTANGAQQVKNALNNLPHTYQGGWKWGREAEDGMFIMSKKIKGESNVTKATDQWVMFKTDQPGAFIPKASNWAEMQVARAKLFPQRLPGPSGSSMVDVAFKAADDISYVDYRGLVEEVGHSPKALVKKFGEITGVKNLISGEAVEAGKILNDFAHEFLFPRLFQFASQPRAKWLMNKASVAFTHAEATAEGIMFGTRKFSGKKGLLNAIYGNVEREAFLNKAPIDDAIIALSKKDVIDVHGLKLGNASLEEINEQFIKGQISAETKEFFTRLDTWDNFNINEIQATQRALGLDEFQPKSNHFGLTRTWVGDHRAMVTDEYGNNIFLASGHTGKAAEKEAAYIAKRMTADSGVEHSVGKVFTSSAEEDIIQAMKLVDGDGAKMAQKLRAEAMEPQFFKELSGQKGTPDIRIPTKDELRKQLLDHYSKMHKYNASITIREGFKSDLTKLAIENPNVTKQFFSRLEAMEGQQGAFSQIQNQALDKLLAPVIGNNSASKIVATANSLLFQWQLGMGNLMFPVVNALTFFQTTLPHMSFVMSSTADDLAKYYSYYPMGGVGGKPAKAMGVLDAVKITGQSVKEMRRPGKTLAAHQEQAIRDGTISPKFVEEWLGEKSINVGQLAHAHEEGYVKTLEKLSSWLPRKSEEFARGQSFITGHIMGRDFLKLEGDTLYRFAKEFTDNTMFLYGSADRAKIITGPVGSAFGMFKNWQMHYIGWMGEYAGQAWTKNNWGPLMWQVAGTWGVGGLGGVPLVGAADAFSEHMTGEGLMEKIYNNFSPTAGDAIYYGVPGFFGASLQGSTASPLADPIRDASMLMSFVQWDRMKAIGQATGKIVESMDATGRHPATDPFVRDALVKAFAPRSITRAMQVTEGNYIKSLGTGNPLIRNLSPVERMFYAAGFNTARIDKEYSISNKLWEKAEEKKKRVQKFGQLWADAQQNKDYDSLRNLQLQASIQGVDISSIMRSALKRMENSRGDIFSKYSDIDIEKYSEILKPE